MALAAFGSLVAGAAAFAASLPATGNRVVEMAAPPLLMPVLPLLAQAQQRLFSRFAELVDVPAEVQAFFVGLAAWLQSAQGVEAFAYVLIVVIVGVGLEWLYWTYAHPALLAADIAQADRPGRILALELRRLLLKGIGLGLFALASTATATALDWPAGAEDVVFTTILAITMLRLSGLLLHLLLSPGSARPRLLPLGNQKARSASRGIWLLAVLVVVGSQLPDAMERLSGLRALPDAVRLATTTAATALVLVGISRLPRVSTARYWRLQHLPPFPTAFFASAAVVATYLLWLAGAGRFAFSLAVVIVVAGTESLLQPIVRFFWPGYDRPEAEFQVVPNLVLRVLRLLVACAGLLAVLAAWNLPAMPMSMGESPAGRIVARLLGACALVLAADVAWTAIKGAIDSRLNHLGPIELESGSPGPNARLVTLLPLLRTAIGVALAIMLILSVLSVLGIEITPLLAGAGVLGIALGFGAQTLVRDMLSGVFYLAEDVFRLGEYIESGSSTKGTVERITLRSVALRHQNGPLHFVPYGTLGAVRNNSRDWIIEKFMLPLPTDVDSDFIRKLVRKIGQEMLNDPALAAVIVTPLKAVLYRIDPGVKLFRCKYQTLPGRQFEVRTVAYKRIEAELKKAGIPFADTSSKIIVHDASGLRAATAFPTNTSHPAPPAQPLPSPDVIPSIARPMGPAAGPANEAGDGSTIMSSTTDKIQGTANQAVGGVKENVGKAVGSDKMQAEGALQQGKGTAQKAVGEAKDAAKDAANKVADAANRNL